MLDPACLSSRRKATVDLKAARGRVQRRLQLPECQANERAAAIVAP
eukprot:COSAG02_NODE_57885_length_279_cov_0.577778_1_plen_45_part_10